LNADINVTSLVDVAFVLLIIFMITAPIMQGGVDVRLPRAEAKPLEPKSGLVVTVDREGRIFMDQTALSYADFRATFPAFCANQNAPLGCTFGPTSGPLRGGGAGAGGDPRGGRNVNRGLVAGAGGGRAVRRGRRGFRERERRPRRHRRGTRARRAVPRRRGGGRAKPVPPTYRVHLVAAPEPTEDARKAPEAVDRPAEAKPAPAPKAKSPKSTVAPAPPPPVADKHQA